MSLTRLYAPKLTHVFLFEVNLYFGLSVRVLWDIAFKIFRNSLF